MTDPIYKKPFRIQIKDAQALLLYKTTYTMFFLLSVLDGTYTILPSRSQRNKTESSAFRTSNYRAEVVHNVLTGQREKRLIQVKLYLKV